MPPFANSKPLYSNSLNKSPNPSSDIVSIDVGGTIFQTTKQTLTLAGEKSLFTSFLQNPNSNNINSNIHFIDRDPEIFSILLSLLRTGHLPSKAKKIDLRDLVFEAKFYGIENLLLNSCSNSSNFEPYNLEKDLILPLNGRDSPFCIATSKFGSLHVSHGNKITSFDWSLNRKNTILTDFSEIDSLLAISSSLVAAGATDFSGLEIIDLEKGSVQKTIFWENVTRSGCTVQAIGLNNEFLFTSFESGRRNSNSIMVYDVNDGFRPVLEIGHNEIFGANLDSAIPATKLQWVSDYNLLMASGSHSGPGGVQGNIQFWDIRSGSVVWEVCEKIDCFADVTVSDNLSAVFKVGVYSGEVFYNDLRNLSSNDHTWIRLGDNRVVINGKKEGAGCRIESRGSQVFCSKGGDLELWSEVLIGSNRRREKGVEERVFRKNLMGRAKDKGGSRITRFAFGGNKMFVIRKDQQFVEVWQNPARGF